MHSRIFTCALEEFQMDMRNVFQCGREVPEVSRVVQKGFQFFSRRFKAFLQRRFKGNKEHFKRIHSSRVKKLPERIHNPLWNKTPCWNNFHHFPKTPWNPQKPPGTYWKAPETSLDAPETHQNTSENFLKLSSELALWNSFENLLNCPETLKILWNAY